MSAQYIGCSLPIIFSETGLENSREIGRFFREFVPENPMKFDVFFRNLPKALLRQKEIQRLYF